MGKIKEYWKEHKWAIIGTACCIAGGAMIGSAVTSMVKDKSDVLANHLREFNNGFVEDMLEMEKGANYCLTINNPGTLESMADSARNFMTKIGMEPDKTITTGMVVFMDRKKFEF